MTEWQPKRFWQKTEIAEQEQGFGVLLDTRPVRTPAKKLLTVPTRAMAEAIALEWQAQVDEIDPLSMPVTRSANATLDKVVPQFSEVADMLAAYAETDLLCHRAETPEALTLLQADAWDPLLDWAKSALGAPLRPVFGIMAEQQPETSLARLKARVHGESAFTITALHDLVSLSGSLVIGLAVLDNVLPPEELWRRSRIDESWQESQWGVDQEASAVAARKRGEFLHASNFHRMSQQIA